MGRWVRVAVAATAAAIIAVIVIAAGGGRDDTKAAAAKKLPVGQIAHRVERLHGLKFRYVPKVEVVAQKDLESTLKGAEGEQKITPRLRDQALAASGVAALAGILSAQDAAQQSGGGGGSGDVEGVYVPERKRVYVVKEAIERSDKEAQVVLAHELTHALEDQHFHDFQPGSRPFADSEAAKQALLEGSATLVELRYAQRFLHARGDLDALLARRARGFQAAKISAPLRDAAAFPYIDGGRFAESLHARGGWRLLAFAHRHPPRTTEAILHPQGWHGTDRQKRPRFDADGALSPTRWRRLGRADVGELDTLAMLRVRLPEADARRGAAGWAAGAFETWSKPGADLEHCKPPCRDNLAAVLAWRWDSQKDAKEFTQLMARAIGGTRRADGVFALDGGAAALKRFGGRRTALAYAPTAADALTLVKAASNG